MKINFKQMFWGFVFILLEIHLIYIDILPEPIGYYLIFASLVGVPSESRTGNLLKKLLIMLVLISIPTVFIQQNVNGNELGSFVGISIWDTYTFFLEILKLVIVFLVVQLIMTVVSTLGDEFLISRSSQTFKIYMTVMLFITLFNTFAMNLSRDIITGFLFFTIPLGLIMEIMFLVLLWKLHKRTWTPKRDYYMDMDIVARPKSDKNKG